MRDMRSRPARAGRPGATMEKVFYQLSRYVSHRVAGLANVRAMLRAGVPLAETPDEATTVVLHDDPFNYPLILDTFPCLRDKRKIAFCVWETEDLPELYLPPLRLMDAVWTCSDFSRAAFAKQFPDVSVVPHVVAPAAVAKRDRESIRRRIGYRPGAFYFYTVADAVNPRKNLLGLLEAFERTFLHDPDVFLVVKQYRRAYDFGGLGNVVSLTDSLTAGEMGALHEVCHCCLSLHHAEAWGLSLSEALAVGNPVIATGYSGNMTFMTPDNSHPVRYTMAPVSEEMCRSIPLFTPAMRWAEPDPGHFAYLLRKVRRQGEDPKRRRRVAASMAAFGPDRVGAIMRDLLA